MKLARIFLMLCLAAFGNSLPAAKPAAKAATQAPVLLDYQRQAFSDFGSHAGFWRNPEGGLGAFELHSASAWGAYSAEPRPGKKLLALDVWAEADGQWVAAQGLSLSAQDMPHAAQDSLRSSDLAGEGALAFVEGDVAVGAYSLKALKSLAKARSLLRVRGLDENADVTLRFDSKAKILTLTLDRSKAALRKVRESVAITLGSGPQIARLSLDNGKTWDLLGDAPRVALGRFELRLSGAKLGPLKAGQGERLAWALKLAPSDSEAKSGLAQLHARWAAQRGQALNLAKTRGQLEAGRFKAVPASRRGLLGRAVATLNANRYARRGELKSDLLSQSKTQYDAFYGDGLAIACLGWFELDPAAAEAALLEITGYSALGALPVPPHAGEELLAWEAAGLPLHGWVGWELFQRDPQVARAQAFFSGLGQHLRNEAAWWPSHRDGDGNGLFAFSRDEERPLAQRLSQPAAAGQPLLLGADPGLSAWVAFNLQAAGLLAQNVAAQDEAKANQAAFLRTQEALKERLASLKPEELGLDDLLPYILGTDSDDETVALKRVAGLKPAGLPWENGYLIPWRAYLRVRALALWGYLAEARALSEEILDFFEKQPNFASIYKENGQGLGGSMDSSTAAVVLELLLGRFEQDILLTKELGAFEASFIQVRSKNGDFFLKRVGLPENIDIYSKIQVETPTQGSILSQNSLILSASERMTFSILSKNPVDVLEMNSKREIFKGTKRAEFILWPKGKYLIKIIEESDKK